MSAEWYAEWVNMVYGGYAAPLAAHLVIAVQKLHLRVEALKERP